MGLTQLSNEFSKACLYVYMNGVGTGREQEWGWEETLISMR